MLKEIYVNFTPSGSLVMRSGGSLVVSRAEQWQRRAIQRGTTKVYDFEIQIWHPNNCFGRNEGVISQNIIGFGDIEAAARWVAVGLI